MAESFRVAVEQGPKGRKVAVWALDWPGLVRGGKDEQSALDILAPYRSRYARVAAAAGLEDEFEPGAALEVVERYEGAGMTDHYGISFASTVWEAAGLPDDEFERRIALLRGCWAVFDDVRRSVSVELEKGPRGGGRDREQIVRHVVYNEMAWAWKVGGPKPPREPAEWVFDEQELPDHRDMLINGLRAFQSEGRPARTWSLAFLVRHCAYHTMDHTWEMQDKDLTRG